MTSCPPLSLVVVVLPRSHTLYLKRIITRGRSNFNLSSFFSLPWFVLRPDGREYCNKHKTPAKSRNNSNCPAVDPGFIIIIYFKIESTSVNYLRCGISAGIGGDQVGSFSISFTHSRADISSSLLIRPKAVVDKVCHKKNAG